MAPEIKIFEEISTYMRNIIQKIIDNSGPRMPCSPQEKKAAELIKQEMAGYCDECHLERFFCNPRAFLGFIKVISLLTLTSFIAYFVLFLNLNFYWTGSLIITIFLLNLVSLVILWNEFFNYREFIDPLFKRKESQNAIGIFKSKKELKNIIIFSGHHDSALQFNLLKWFKIGYPIIIFVGLIVLFLWFFISSLILILSFANMSNYKLFFGFTLIIFILGLPSLVGLYFFVSFGERANKVPGAVDNLSAVAIILGLGQYLKTHRDILPENTEIRLISFGCEEAGLRGAYRYVEKHLKELKEFDAECVNMDAIQSLQNIAIINFEPSTRTKHSDYVVNKLLESAKQGNIKINSSALGGSNAVEKIFGQISGGTDATAFSKFGIKAANISAMNLKEMLRFYHQPTDTIDKIEAGALEEVLKLCINYLLVQNV